MKSHSEEGPKKGIRGGEMTMSPEGVRSPEETAGQPSPAVNAFRG